MTIQEMLSRSFATVKREPALWVLGTLFAIFGGGYGGTTFQNSSGGGGDSGAGLPAGFDPAAYVALFAVLALLAIVAAILFFLLRCVAEAGLIHGAERALTGEDVHWRDLWRAGWSSYAQRLIKMHIILALPAILFIGLIVVLSVTGLVLLVGSTSSLDAAAATYTLMPLFVALICCVLPLTLIYIAVEVVLSVLRLLAARAIVMDQMEAMAAIRLAWARMKEQKGLTFTFFVVNLVIGGVASLIINALLALVVLLLGAPLLLMANSSSGAIPLIILLGVAGLALFTLIAAVVQGPLVGFMQTFWTLAWRRLNPRGQEVAVQAGGYYYGQ